MTVLIGASDGVYRASDVPFENVEQVLDVGFVTEIATFDAVDGIFTATTTGLYYSTDTGDSWENLDVPTESVWSVHATESGLYVGTAPAHLYRSDDGGQTWSEIVSLQEQPSRSKWTAPGSIPPRLRALGAHSKTPERLVAGVEAGKLHVTEDSGETWVECGNPIPDDIHHVLVRAPEEFIVSTGYLGVDGEQPGGLYRTVDAGETWTRLDTGDRAYFREAIDHDERLYASAARDAPPWWGGGADAVLYEANDEMLTSVSYSGGPAEAIDAWAVFDGDVIAGTVFRAQASDRSIDASTAAGSSGSILQRTMDGEWQQVGSVPAGIHSIISV